MRSRCKEKNLQITHIVPYGFLDFKTNLILFPFIGKLGGVPLPIVEWELHKEHGNNTGNM